MNLWFVAAAVVAAGVSSSVAANDISGLRVEGQLGWDQPDGWPVGKPSGLLYGIGVGYDLALGDTISLGVDGELAGSTGKEDLKVFYADGTEEVYGEGRPGRDLYLGARFTGKVADRAALFAKFGYSSAKFEARSFDPTRFGPGLEETRGGWRLGAGGQYLLGRAYVGLEYRYTDYGSDSFFGSLKRNQVVGSVGIRF